MKVLNDTGFEIFSNVLSESLLGNLRTEMERVVSDAGSVCVRKLMSRSVIVSELASSPPLLKLLPEGYFPVRSIFFDKTVESNWPVAWHQDLTIAVKERFELEGYGPWSIKYGVPHVQPPREVLENIMTLRLHLDDTPSSNGALQIIPQSHKLGRLTHDEIGSIPKLGVNVCDCEAGDVLLMSPLIVHASQRSLTPSRRRIIHIEYATEGVLDSKLEWAEGSH